MKDNRQINKGDIVCVWILEYGPTIQNFLNNPKTLLGFAKVIKMGTVWTTVKFVATPSGLSSVGIENRLPESKWFSFTHQHCTLFMKAKNYKGQDWQSLLALAKLTIDH